MLFVFFLQDPFLSFIGTLRISTRPDDCTFIQNPGIAAGRVLVCIRCHRSDRAEDAQMCHESLDASRRAAEKAQFLGPRLISIIYRNRLPSSRP
jgi:hypothetical protein